MNGKITLTKDEIMMVGVEVSARLGEKIDEVMSMLLSMVAITRLTDVLFGENDSIEIDSNEFSEKVSSAIADLIHDDSLKDAKMSIVAYGLMFFKEIEDVIFSEEYQQKKRMGDVINILKNREV